MIVFFLGTPAELIKCHPVIRRLEAAGSAVTIVDSGQASEALAEELAAFGYGAGVRVVPLFRRGVAAPKGVFSAFFWFLRALRAGHRRRKELGGCRCWVVHGDTISTLAGAIIGRLVGVREVAHIEAGLRTASLFEPFPEEITRRLVSRVANLHFPSHEQARENIVREKVRGAIVPTGGNTQISALAIVLKEKGDTTVPFAEGTYGVANIHRFENMKLRWNEVKELLLAAAAAGPLVVVDYSQFQTRLDADPAFRDRLRAANVHLIPRLPFSRFVKILQRARYLLTDGNGNQDDAAILGLPTLIFREHVETPTALWPEGPALLSGARLEEAGRFLKGPEAFRKPPKAADESPARIVAERLLAEAGA